MDKHPVTDVLLLWGAMVVLRDPDRPLLERMVALEYLQEHGLDPRCEPRGTESDRKG